MSLLTTKGRYALRIAIYLAINGGSGRPSRKQEIAEAEGLSVAYVEQILTKLRTAGLVESVRGVCGGFRLLGESERICVEDVLTAAEGRLDVAACSSGCTRASACVTEKVWREADAALATVFRGHTVGELAQAAIRLREGRALNYEI